jgi:hypothetical protein
MNAEIGKELIDHGEIAKTIIEQMGSQVDLLVTLATAVFGEPRVRPSLNHCFHEIVSA